MTEDRIRVVLDTNVFIAGYWSVGSASARLIAACIDGRLAAYYTPEVRGEVELMLHRVKVRVAYLQLVERFWRGATLAQGVAVGVTIDDPDDRKFLEAAASVEADFLVTNDEHLLRLHYLGRTEVIRPASLARLLSI